MLFITYQQKWKKKKQSWLYSINIKRKKKIWPPCDFGSIFFLTQNMKCSEMWLFLNQRSSDKHGFTHQWQWPFILSFGTKKKRKDWDYPQGMFVSWASDSAWRKMGGGKNSTVPQLGTQTFCMCLPFPPGWRTLWNYRVALQSCLCFSWTFATFPIFLLSWTEVIHRGAVSFYHYCDDRGCHWCSHDWEWFTS